MILCTSKLRMRARAGASALVVMRRYGASALASASAAMRKDAADGEANELPFAWPSRQIAKAAVVGSEGTGATSAWVVGIGGRVALWGMRVDANAVAVGDREAPQSHRRPPPTRRGTARVRRPASTSETSVADG